jgi:hypothetical protein
VQGLREGESCPQAAPAAASGSYLLDGPEQTLHGAAVVTDLQRAHPKAQSKMIIEVPLGDRDMEHVPRPLVGGTAAALPTGSNWLRAELRF